jgi:hypothetical protein
MMAAAADLAEGGIVGDTYEIFINVNAAPLRKNPLLLIASYDLKVHNLCRMHLEIRTHHIQGACGSTIL